MPNIDPYRLWLTCRRFTKNLPNPGWSHILINTNQSEYIGVILNHKALLKTLSYLERWKMENHARIFFIVLAKVSYIILLENMESSGLSGNSLKLFESNGWIQIVKIFNCMSFPNENKYDVPQGTLLGPNLSNLWINEYFDSKANENEFNSKLLTIRKWKNTFLPVFFSQHCSRY